MSDTCPGCGAALQHDDPDRPGYCPPAPGGPLCRRCFRLRHYGQSEGRSLTGAEAGRQIARALAPAGAVVAVTDLADFEGSLPPARFLPAGKPVILAVNKIDLLPPKAVAREVVAWASARWQDRGARTAPRAVLALSAMSGAGLSALVKQMQTFGGHHQVIAVVGATSTGKSTLLRRLLRAVGADGAPTVSRFRGTTQAASRWHVEDLDLTIYDTPGFVPGDRLGDLLCPSCAAQLVPERVLASKLLSVAPGHAVVFGGLAAFALAFAEERTFLCYASERVVLHRTAAVKAAELLATRPEWLLPWACASCRAVPAARVEEIHLGANEDLAVTGLGWISLRGGPAVVRVTAPEGVRIVRRPALFGPRG